MVFRNISLLFILSTAGLAAMAQTADNALCSGCHGDKSMLGEAGERADSLVIVEDSLKNSPHEGFSCVDCHQDLASGDVPHPPRLAPATCSPCHDDVTEKFKGSLHDLRIKPPPGLKSPCAACHGTHAIRKSDSAESMTHRAKLADTCATCHPPHPDGSGPVAEWKRSIHGRAALSWEVDDAPTCSVCHEPHSIRLAEDPASSLNRRNQMKVCAACHASETKALRRGVHGKSFEAGNMGAAICVDCHGTHDIQRPRDTHSHVYAAAVSDTCGKCHGDPDLTTRFNLRADSVITYNESFHGRGTRWGATNVANCASCHRYHDIRPAADPGSSVHPRNLVLTCGQAECHPAATFAFAQTPVHRRIEGGWLQPVRLTRVAYLIIISFTLVFMVFHQVLEARVLWGMKQGHHLPAAEPGAPPVPPPVLPPLSAFEKREGRWVVVRWDRNQIVQHLALVISFTLLVVTGFMLKIPESWTQKLGDLGPAVFDLRSLVHRISAVVMTLGSIYHLYWIIATPRGRREFAALLPDPLHDLKDMRGTLAWFLGLRDAPPPGRRYTYREKLEYWALVWGTLVMVASGVILWTASHWSALVLELAQVVHGFEALLAFLAILIWHMLGVHLKPAVFPMNRTWLDGSMPAPAMEEEHKTEYDQMVAWQGFDPAKEDRQ